MGYLRPRVITAPDARRSNVRSATASGEDAYMSKLVKYIPGEAIALYQASVGFIPDSHTDLIPKVSLLVLILTPVWMFFGTKVHGEPPAWFQTVMAPIAFAIWLLALNSPTVTAVLGSPLEDWMGALALVIATAIIPLIEKIFVK